MYLIDLSFIGDGNPRRLVVDWSDEAYHNWNVCYLVADIIVQVPYLTSLPLPQPTVLSTLALNVISLAVPIQGESVFIHPRQRIVWNHIGP